MTEQDMTGDQLRAEYDMLESGLPLMEGMPELITEAEARMEAIAEEIKDRMV